MPSDEDDAKMLTHSWLAAYSSPGCSASTYRAPSGCYEQWCDPQQPWDGHDGNPCGFGGRDEIDRNWHPYDLDKMLELYTLHSQPYKPPQFYSGYNELVLAA